MALYDTAWYVNAGDQSTTGYYAVAKRPQNTAVAAGVLRRQFTAPAVGSERVFVCIVAGTTANVTDATWVLTRGAKTTDGTATWQECTGIAAVNGDLTNTVNWTAAKAAGTPTLGAIIKRNSGASYQICSTAGTMAASEPSFSDTAGVTTTDGTSVWTSLGPVSNFTGGQAPHARLATVGFVAGQTTYIADNHAESQATSITISAALLNIVCHNHSGSYPPAAGDVATGATINVSGAASITVGGSAGGYVYGVAFLGGSGSTSSTIQLGPSVGGIVLDNCSLQLANTNTASLITLGGVGAYTTLTLNNTSLKFGNVSQSVNVYYGVHVWQNTSPGLAAGSSVPTNLFKLNLASASPSLVVEAVDLNSVTSLISFNQAMAGYFTFKDCKLNASATISTPTSSGFTGQLIRSDSGATAYKSTRYAYEGTETTETTITRVGGAVDPAGQAQTRKIVTTANSLWARPFKAQPYAVWNATTAANVTVTVYGTINSASLPNNDDIWLEVEYLGSSATPLGTIVTTGKASVLASSAAVASDSSTWNGGGSGAGWSPFKLVATLSSPQPAMAGYIHARVRAGKASATYYIDPQVYLS